MGKEIRQKDGGWTTYLGAAIASVVCSSSLYNVNGILKIVLRLGCLTPGRKAAKSSDARDGAVDLSRRRLQATTILL